MLWCNDNDSLPSGGNVTNWTPETGLSQCQAASPASTLVQTLASHLCLYLCFISFFSILPHVLFSFVNAYSWWLEYFKAALGPSIARLQLSRDEVTPLNKSMQYSAEKSRPQFLHNNCNVAKSMSSRIKSHYCSLLQYFVPIKCHYLVMIYARSSI